MERKTNFLIEPAKNTPYVNVNYQEGVLSIKGRSSPENTLEFYNPVFEAIEKLIDSPKIELTANFRMLYFNTSSARCFFMIIKLLKKLKNNGKNIVINWYADEDDEDMQETGEDYQDIVNIPFNIHLVEEGKLM